MGYSGEHGHKNPYDSEGRSESEIQRYEQNERRSGLKGPQAEE